MSDAPHITPTREAFLQYAQEGNLIPVYREILADFETPLSAYRKIRSDGEAFLCESVEGGEHLSRYSFVGCNPRGIIRQDGDQVQVIEGGKGSGKELPEIVAETVGVSGPVPDQVLVGSSQHLDRVGGVAVTGRRRRKRSTSAASSEALG